MDWYYVVDRERVGPVDDATIAGLIKSKKINKKTLVWNETLTDWTPLKNVDPPKAQEQQSEQSLAAPTSKCSECGQFFPEDELVQYFDSLVCADCKPGFVQKVKEGASIGALEYAGFWIRVGAKLIDGIIFMIISLIINFAFGLFVSMPDLANNPENMGMVMALAFIPAILQWVINIAYVTYFVGKYAATPGKMVCGIKVITSDNAKVSYLRAFARFFAEIVSGIVFCIGYIMVAFDSEKRSLHDRMCDTRVVKK